MVQTVDLFKQAKSGDNEGRVYSMEAARFNEAPETTRVLAESQQYLTYNMKRRHVLRVLKRSNLLKGTMRAHSKPIHAVKFVNYRSNVAASSAEGEFAVWVVTDESGVDDGTTNPTAELTIKIYFKLQDPVTIPCFSFFINADNQRPDLLILYDTQAAILNSSSLIECFATESLEATLQRNSKKLRGLNQAVSEESLCSVGSGGWLAFTTEPTKIAACTLRNANTPSWACCEGDVVRALHVLDAQLEEDATILVAASSKAVFQWVLTGTTEPTLLRKFVVDGNIVAMESSREIFAVFDDRKQLALVSVHSTQNFQCTHYMMPHQVKRGGFCFNRTADGCAVMADMANHLTLFHLKPSHGEERQQNQRRDPPITEKPDNLSASSISTKTATTTKPAPTPAPVTAGISSAGLHGGNTIMANLINQLGLKPHQANIVSAAMPTAAQGTPPQTAPTTSAPPPPATAGTPQRASPYGYNGRPATAGLAGGARAALHNSSLPQAPTDGLLAAAVQQAEDDVRRAVERLESVVTNTSQVLELLPDTVRRDHEQLLNLSLEAQMTELQQSRQTPQTVSRPGTTEAAATTTAAGGGGAANLTPFETYALVFITDSLSRSIAKGVRRGVDEAMMTHLDHEVRHAAQDSVRQIQKSIIKNRLDEALKESTTQFVSQLTRSVENVVKRELAEVFGSINESFVSLMNENAALQKELNAIMSSGLLEEISRMRKELTALRESAASQEAMTWTPSVHATSNFHGRRPSPETILSTALSMMKEEQEYRKAMEYLLMVKQPPLLLQFFTSLQRENENTYSELIDSKAPPNEVWCSVLLQLVEAAATEAESEVVVTIAVDILSERQGLMHCGSVGKNLATAIRALEKKSKAESTNTSFLHCLKDLDKLMNI